MALVEKTPYFSCPSGRVGLLSSMFTVRDYRRQGIAKELLSRVVEEAREYGYGHAGSHSESFRSNPRGRKEKRIDGISFWIKDRYMEDYEENE